MLRTSLACVCALAPWVAMAQVDLPMVDVGDPGNPGDPSTGHGSVGAGYRIGRFEVRNADYAAFLNSVARFGDPHGLWSPTNSPMYGISRSGSGTVGSPFLYSVDVGYADLPVTYVNYYDAARFANWLHNGQPDTGYATNGTTETGSYTFSGATGIPGRNPDATWVLPSQEEWYKAAFYDPTASATSNFWTYATRSDAIPNSRRPNTNDANSANFFRNATGDPAGDFLNDGYGVTGEATLRAGTNYLTEVGGYEGGFSYFGTFDQGGNVWEWTETTTNLSGSIYGIRYGGSWALGAVFMSAVNLDFDDPLDRHDDVGFRLVLIPEPGVGPWVLCGAGLAAIWVGLRRWRGSGRG